MKNYFNFSKGQKVGVTTLAILIVAQIIYLNKGSGISIPDPFIVSTEQYELIENQNQYENKYKKLKKNYTLKQFNPNEYNESDWNKIGFSEKQASIIVNFKNKTGGFKAKTDVEKVFVINEKKFNELKPFLQLPETKPEFKYDNITHYEKKDNLLSVPIQLNSASIEDLIKIKGIGELTAKGIIKHRTLIGGFHSTIQLKEVYGIEDDNYEKIIKQIEIDFTDLIKVNVNELSIFDLKKHHYISWNTAEAIINKRLMGKLSNLEFLTFDKILSKEKLAILLPYIEY